ncbi:MAG TPA: hypothetical protein VJ976_03640 [Ornithinimicrobium sp.]|uniref:hypothetical protein n=1 Tax=Ornithinimicrobium sp. TaxID=1977084 RepID=UPI002B465344|nr:hypothetical protein [Ornithinimicrobium sp.]HKJ11464.1 hypothetical protein [Ornithinimicrobium sp.]
MRLDRAGILANALLFLTLGVVALTSWATPKETAGAPVAGGLDGRGVQRMVIVGVPGWSWADVDESTPTLRRLADTAVSGSTVDRGGTTVDGADPAGGSFLSQMRVLRRTLESQGSCVTEVARPARAAASVRGDPCPVHLVRAQGLDVAGLEQGAARLAGSLPEGTLLVLTGYSRAGEMAQVHPVLVTQGGRASTEATGAGTFVRSASTRQPGLVRPADLVATAVAITGAAAPTSLGGAEMTQVSSDGADPSEMNRDLAMALTLVPRVTTGYLVALGSVFGIALLGLAAWARWPGRPSAAASSRALVSLAGSALAALGVAGYAAAWLPWWRVGTDPTTDPRTVGLGLPLLALLVATVLAGAVVLAAAWAPWVWWVRHRLAPVGVVTSLTVLVIGVDVMRGASLGLVSAFGLRPLATGRFYGLSTLTFGFLASAAILLSACLASLLIRRGRPRGLPVIAAVLIGLAATFVVAAPDAGADVGGAPALLVATFLLATATAGRRVAASSVFLSLLVVGAVVGVVMVADWMRPAGERTTLGRMVQQALDGKAWDGFMDRVSAAVEVMTQGPAPWVVLLGLALWSYAVLARRSALHHALKALWDYPVMHACASALVAAWVLGGLANRPGVPLVAAGLTLAAGAVLCVTARGRTARVSAASPAG